MELKAELTQLGLESKEADIYLALLALREGSATSIAELAELPRSTTYDVLNHLIKKKLVREVKSGKKAHFIPSDPSIFQSNLNHQKLQLDQSLATVKNIMDDLTQLSAKAITRPTTKLYHGAQAVVSLLRHIITSKELKVFGKMITDNFIIEQERSLIREMRSHKKSQATKILVVPTDQEDELVSSFTNANPKDESILVSEKAYPINGAIFIYNQKIALFDYADEISAVVLHHPDSFITVSTLFQLAKREAIPNALLHIRPSTTTQ